MRYTPILALAMGNGAMALFTNSTTSGTATGTETGSETGTGTGTAPTGTATGNPDVVGGFAKLGCVGSSNGFPTFTISTSSNDMTSELCAASCEGSEYFGLYTGDCYCGDELAEALSDIVSDDLCDIPCPGNAEESCGGNSGPGRLARRQVPSTVLLTVFQRVAAVSGTTTVTATETATGTGTGALDTVTVTTTMVGTATTCAPGADCPLITVTSTFTTVVAPAPTNVIIICFGNYCAPQTDCGCDTHWRVLCEDDSCRSEVCDASDEYCNRLVVCHDGECEYTSYTGDECNSKVLCVDGQCHKESCHGDECKQNLVCNGSDCQHEACTGDECHTLQTCDNGSCQTVPQCTDDCPAPPAPSPAPTSSHQGPFTPKPAESAPASNGDSSAPSDNSTPASDDSSAPAQESGSMGNDNQGDEPAIVTAGSGKIIPAIGITAFGMVAGFAFLL